MSIEIKLTIGETYTAPQRALIAYLASASAATPAPAAVVAEPPAPTKRAPKSSEPVAGVAAAPVEKPQPTPSPATPAPSAPTAPVAGVVVPEKTAAVSAPTAAPAAAEPQPSTAAADRPSLSKRIVAFGIRDRAAAVALLARFGVKGLKELPDTSLPAFADALTAVETGGEA